MSQTSSFPSDRERLVEPAADRSERRARPLSPEQLRSWLEAHVDEISDRWLLEVRSRVEKPDEPEAGPLREFLRLLTEFLPHGLGVYRDQVVPVYHQAAELYGNLAAIRGLAAGEAVEEVQLLREVLLRFLYRDPPGGGAGLGLRELLQLSRTIDQMVTHASVGHTDSLFFNLFHGNGVPEAGAEKVLAEVRDQLATLREELARFRALEASSDGGG